MKSLSLALGLLGLVVLTGCEDPSVKSDRVYRETAGQLPKGCTLTLVKLSRSPYELYVVQCEAKRSTSTDWTYSSGKSTTHAHVTTVED